MSLLLKAALCAAASCIAMSAVPAHAASFTNGNFESGSFAGYTIGAGYRGNDLNPLVPGNFLPGGSEYDSSLNHSAIVGSSYVDPHVSSSLLGSVVYNGNYSARIEDTTTGGYASVIQQQVNNYTDNSIFFVYKAVLNGAHGPSDAATVQVLLKDLTTGVTLYNQSFNAASGGSGVGSQFSYDASSNAYYTPLWQTVQLDTSKNIGDNFILQVLAADCEPTGHYGYVYLDGFGSVTPPVIIPPGGGVNPVPLPAAFPMFGVALLGLGAFGFSKKRKAERSVAV